MIIGKLHDLRRYEVLSENFKVAIDYLLSTDLQQLEVGKYVIEGEDVYLMRDSYQPKDIKECFFESHERYADLQMVLSGQEGFGYTNAAADGIQVTQVYDAQKDMAKYDVEAEFMYTLNKGSFAIVFPEDLHMPKIKMDQEAVEKVVIKIKL